MSGFYNTIQADSQLMIVYNADGLKQEDAVMEVLNKLKRAAFFQVQGCLPWMHRDSLKRALSNLYERGKVMKDTDKANMVMNPETGKRCHQYFITT